MCAMAAKDGSMHHSASRASLHDEMSERKAAPPMEKPAMGGGASKDVSNMDIKDVVEKHGPAHEVHVKHDHEAGAHHVTSHHKGAHHKSTHGSAHEAHMHGAMAAGEMGENEENNETPDMEAQEQEPEGAGIPGMA